MPLRNLNKSLLILLSLAFLAGCASRKKQFEEKTAKVSQALIKVFENSNKPGGSWFQYNFLENPIVFASREEKLIHIFHHGKLKPAPFSWWSERLPKNSATFDFFTHDKTKHLLIDMDQSKDRTSESLVHLILHEGFHGFVQVSDKGWKVSKISQGRGLIYPLLSLPRYYRFEMQQSLIEYLKTEDLTYLQVYSYWFWKWKTNFFEEYNNYTDRLEGAAEFYAMKQMTLLYNQYRSTEVSPLDYFLSTPMGQKNLKMEFSLDVESYVLGVLAGLSLEKLKVKGWQKKVTAGESLLNILSKQQKRQRKRPSNKIQNELLQISIQKMLIIDKDGRIDKIISDLSDPRTLRVLIRNKNAKIGSFSVSQMIRPFFNFSGLTNVEMIKLNSSFNLSRDSIDLKLKKGDYWISASQTPCWKNEPATILIYKKSELKFADKKITTLAHPKFSAPVSKTDLNKIDWYCID